MCCGFLALVLLGPRFVGIFWWLFDELRWSRAFNSWGDLWWIWAALGIAFLPWTTLMYVIVSPGGINGFDWVWIGLMVAADVVSYGGGYGRKQLPGYQGY